MKQFPPTPTHAWCDGLPAPEMEARIRAYAERFEDLTPEATAAGVLLAEARPVEFVAAWIAGVRARIPLILANPAWGERELTALAESFSPSLILGALKLPPRPASKHPELPEGAILIPTGGSSGRLRFAHHTWERLAAHWAGLGAWRGGRAVDSLCVLPLYHVSGLMQLVRALVSGGSIAFPGFSSLCKGKFPSAPRGDGVRWCISLVHTQLKRLLDAGQGESLRDAVEVIWLGGGPPDEDFLNDARRLDLPVVLTYGMTEIASMVALARINAEVEGTSLAACILDHCRIKITGTDEQSLPAGTTGEIRISGPSLFFDYFPQDAGIGPSADGWWRSGDQGSLTAEGLLRVEGRMDRVIISGGEKVDPAEVEAVLMLQPGVTGAWVCGLPDPEWGQAVAALVAGEVGLLAVSALREAVRKALAPYKVPKRIRIVETLPRNDLGKLDRARAVELLKAS